MADESFADILKVKLDPAASPSPSPSPSPMPSPSPTPQIDHGHLQQKLINVQDPDTGEIGSIPMDQLPHALATGYTQVSNHEVSQYLKHQKFDTLPEQAKSVAEGAVESSTFGLVPGFFGSEQDQRDRAEVNPNLKHVVGGGLGLLASSALLPGGGAAGALEALGEAGAKAAVPALAEEGAAAAAQLARAKWFHPFATAEKVAQLAAEGAAPSVGARIGGAAVKNLIQSSIMAGTDEVGKMMLNDPHQSFGTAAANIGLSGMLGGALGAGVGSINPLWEATAAPKVGALLDKLREGASHAQGFRAVIPEASQLFSGALPETVGGLFSMLTHHDPITGYVAGKLTKAVGAYSAKGIQLGLIKVLESAAENSPEGFKSAVDYLTQMARGETLLNQAAKAVIEPATSVLPLIEMPSQEQLKKLDEKLKTYQLDQSSLINTGGKLGHYMPEHAAEMAMGTVNAVNFLNSLRPQTPRLGMLDAPLPVSKSAANTFNKALTVAQAPLTVLHAVKTGTVGLDQVNTLKNVYPGLYARMSSKLYSEMVDRVHEQKPLPYKTRLGLSLFLGHPLDSSMLPHSIASAQRAITSLTPNQQKQVAVSGANLGKLDKLASSAATAGQAREMAKMG